MITQKDKAAVRSLIADCFGIAPTGERISSVPVLAKPPAMTRDELLEEEVACTLALPTAEQQRRIDDYVRQCWLPWNAEEIRDFWREALRRVRAAIA